MKVYVVMGTTGEYSDRDEWQVCGYTDEDQAKLHVKRASEHARVADKDRRTSGRLFGRDKETNPYDPDMQMDYTGTSYYHMTVDMFDDLEGYMATVAAAKGTTP